MFFYNELNNELSEDVQQVYTSWLEANKLTASDKAAGDYFGYSVSVSGDGSIIVVGAYYEDPSGVSDAGSAYVFTKTGDTWTQQKITASDKAATDWFGRSVAVSGDGSTIVVGANYEDPSGVTNAGSAYVFTKNGSTWTQAQKITASDKQQWEVFGNSVSVSGDGSVIVVGAVHEYPDGSFETREGSIYVFTKTGNTWIQSQKLTASDRASYDYFGYSVSVSGDGSIIVVGAYQEDPSGVSDAGSAYVFTKNGDTWTEVQKITASDKESVDRFGNSVSVSGDGSIIVVGAYRENSGGVSDAGSAYVFTKNGDTWTEVQKIIASDPESNDEFGHSVSVSGDGSVIVVGAYLEDPGGSPTFYDAGSAYVFTKNGDTWTEVQKITSSDKEREDYFGHSVAVSNDGSVIVVGAYQENPSGAADAGSVYVFQGQ